LEPLPTGSALVDYCRNRLGKAGRLILETLTQAYFAGLNNEGSPRDWLEAKEVVSTTAVG